MTVVDTHVHYWEEPTADRPHDPEGIHWGAAVTAEKLLDFATAAGVDRIVQVTPALMGFDNRYSIEAAQRYSDRIVGVFARFDALAADVDARLKDLMAQPKMLGIRITLHIPPYDAWLRDGVLDPFLTAAERQNVPVELFVPYQGRELQRTARRYPGIRFLIDHMGIRRMPGEPPDRFADWPALIELAAEPNVWVKVSYFPEAAPDGEAYPFPTSLRHFEEYYKRAGAARMIWGSNYPPSARACTYRQSVTFIEEASSFLTASRPRRDSRRKHIRVSRPSRRVFAMIGLLAAVAMSALVHIGDGALHGSAGDGRRRISRHSVRGAAGRRAALAAARTARTLDRRARGVLLRQQLSARQSQRPLRQSEQYRRLSLPQRLHPRRSAAEGHETRGDRVVSRRRTRRRLQHRLRCERLGEDRRRHRGERQLSRRRTRLLRLSGPGRRKTRGRRLRRHGSAIRVALGAAEHRRIRRRFVQRHDCRRIGWCADGARAHGRARFRAPVRACDHGEQRHAAGHGSRRAHDRRRRGDRFEIRRGSGLPRRRVPARAAAGKDRRGAVRLPLRPHRRREHAAPHRVPRGLYDRQVRARSGAHRYQPRRMALARRKRRTHHRYAADRRQVPGRHCELLRSLDGARDRRRICRRLISESERSAGRSGNRRLHGLRHAQTRELDLARRTGL